MERSLPEKPEETDLEGSTLLITTLAVEVPHLVSVISVALGFSTVQVVVYCMHHKILKWLIFVMIPSSKRLLIQTVSILT